MVKLIADSFAAINKPVMPVDELLKTVENDPKVWSLYSLGYTQCLNQCERPASTLKCMQFKPQNIVELASFIAAIRPGLILVPLCSNAYRKHSELTTVRCRTLCG